MIAWFILSFGVLAVVVNRAVLELRKPVSFAQALRKETRATVTGLAIMGVVTYGMYLVIAGLMARGEARIASENEFATAMTQALERVAYLKGGDPGVPQAWSAEDPDGSRFAILRDGVGSLVRAENLSRRACLGALGYLSPYAASVLVMRDERGVVGLDARAKACPDGDARMEAVFRAPA